MSAGDAEVPRESELVREARRVLGPFSAEALAGDEHSATYEQHLREGKDPLDALLATVYPLALEQRGVAGEFLSHFIGGLLGDGRSRISARLQSFYGPEDLVQSVVADLIPRLGELEFRTRNEYQRLLLMRLSWKSQRRARPSQASLDPLAVEQALSGQQPGERAEPLTPLSTLASEEDERLVVLAMSLLEADDRELLRWSMSGWTRERMAEAADCSVPTLRKRLERARVRLGRELRRLQGESDG